MICILTQIPVECSLPKTKNPAWDSMLDFLGSAVFEDGDYPRDT